jgi:CubicO group peptidase (beta-lactamase class C family)
VRGDAPDGAGQLVDPRFVGVADAFGRVVAEQSGTGAALCVHCDGEVVVDLWGGFADGARTRPWTRETTVMPYSVGKPLAAVCALRLVDEGRLGLDEPVQRYWPEFRTRATVRHVLAHQAGTVSLDRPVPTEVFYDWHALCALLAAQAPAWEPGSAHGESALFFGHLVGELVRRIDGRSVGTFLREEICEPNDIDFAFGLPVAELTGLGNITGPGAHPGAPALYELALANPPGSRDPHVVNSARWRAAEIPAVNGHGTARGLTAFYQALLDGRVLSPELVRQATMTQRTGRDLVFGSEKSWGLGFSVDADGFGMGGLGGSYAGVSLVGGYVIAFVTATMGTHERVERLERLVRDCLDLRPSPR